MSISQLPQPAAGHNSRSDVEDALVRDHLPLVQYAVSEIAGRLPRHVNRDDLVSAAMLGLAQSARTYEADRGIAFDRYAMIRLRGALLDELRSRDWASRSVRGMARRVDAAAEGLRAELGRAPSVEETAAAVGVDPAELHKLADDVHRATVLNYDALVVEGDLDSLLPSAAESPPQALEARERRAYLIDAVVALPERLRTVVVGYFFDERPMQEIADELGVSESRVSQMRAEALELLRSGITSQLEPERLAPEPRPNGRVARRKAAYYATVAAGSEYATRLGSRPRAVHERLAALSA